MTESEEKAERTREIWRRASRKRRRKLGTKRCAEMERDAYLRRNYGITLLDEMSMCEAHGGKCAICRSELEYSKNWSVDHCHSTGNVRALLCQRCNSGLGQFKDDPELMREAARYIEYHGPKG